MRQRRARTFGTHNLHDDEGVPTFFADVIGFTEASRKKIRAKGRKSRLRRAKHALAGYRIITCKQQKDLVCALKRQHYKVVGQQYVRVHGGLEKVTPARGEWAVETIERRGILRRATGRRVVFVWGHRINAAFPPHIRGEARLRTANWRKHDAVSNDMIQRYLKDGWEVRAGGDPNTPKRKVKTGSHPARWVRAYSSLRYEVGRGHFDRLASSSPIKDFTVLSRSGSDHPRLRASA